MGEQKFYCFINLSTATRLALDFLELGHLLNESQAEVSTTCPLLAFGPLGWPK